MLITKTSRFTGKVHTLDIPVTQEQIDEWQNTNRLIQDVMPSLTGSQREFLMTGTTQEEWDEAFKDDED